MTGSSRMKWHHVLLVNLLILLSIFVILEVGTRIAAPEYVGAYFDDNTTWGNPIYRNAHWGHRVHPDMVDAKLQRTSTEQRILFIGDSVTFGYGVDYTDTYHEVARSFLEDSGCEENVIHAVGRYHVNLRQLLESEFREFIFDGFGADIIVYQFNVNDLDIENPPRKSDNDTLSWRERFEKFRLSYLNRSAFLKFIQSWSIRMAHRSNPPALLDSLRYSDISNPAEYADTWESFEEDLVGLNEKLASRGVRFEILLVPESIQISRAAIDNDFATDISGIAPWPNEKVIEIARRHGIPVFDTLPALQNFRARNPHTRLYFPNDQNHPNRQGHAVIGEATAQYLSESATICRSRNGSASH